MKVYKLFFKILWDKKVRVIATLAIFFLIFTRFIPTEDQINQLQFQQVKLVYFDKDQSDLSQALTQYLEANNEIIEIEEDKELIEDALFEGNLEYAMIIEEGFQEDVEAGETPPIQTYVMGNEMSMNIVDGQINNFLGIYHTYHIFFEENLQDEDRQWILSEMEETMDVEIESSIVAEEYGDVVSSFEGLTYYLIFLSYPMIAVCFLLIGETITKMESSKLKRRDLVSGFPEGKRTIQIFLSSYIFMLIIWLLFLVPLPFLIKINPLAYDAGRMMLFSSFIHVLATTSIVLLFAHIFPTKEAMNFFSTFISLLVCFSAGVFVTREFVWQPLLQGSKITPTYWDVWNQEMILERLSSNEFLMNEYWMGIAIMGLIVGVALIITIILRKVRNQEK